MTVLPFPPERRHARPDLDGHRPAGTTDGAWGDERARLRLVAALQRSLLEGLLLRGPGADTVLRAFR